MKVAANCCASDNVPLYTGHQSFDCICSLRCPQVGYLSRQDIFRQYTASVLMPHINGVYDNFSRIGNPYKLMVWT